MLLGAGQTRTLAGAERRQCGQAYSALSTAPSRVRMAESYRFARAMKAYVQRDVLDLHLQGLDLGRIVALRRQHRVAWTLTTAPRAHRPTATRGMTSMSVATRNASGDLRQTPDGGNPMTIPTMGWGDERRERSESYP